MVYCVGRAASAPVHAPLQRIAIATAMLRAMVFMIIARERSEPRRSVSIVAVGAVSAGVGEGSSRVASTTSHFSLDRFLPPEPRHIDDSLLIPIQGQVGGEESPIDRAIRKNLESPEIALPWPSQMGRKTRCTVGTGQGDSS